MSIIIHGIIERIMYFSEKNGFTVARLQEEEKSAPTTLIGNLSGINPGQSLKLSGQWVHNKRYGVQFQVESFEVTVPATVHGIEKYLGSGLIKGIGPVVPSNHPEIWIADPGHHRECPGTFL